MELALMVAAVAVGITLVSVAVDLLQTWHIRKVQNSLTTAQKTWDARGDIGEQIGDWLLFKEKPEDPTNLEILSKQVGANLYISMRNAGAAALSGDSRHQKMVEDRVHGKLEEENPELKVLSRFADSIGLETGDIPTIVATLKKYNVLPKAILNQTEEGQASW